MSENFSKYGPEFQDRLTHILLRDRVFADQMNDILDVNYFEFESLICICKTLYDMKRKYKVHPTMSGVAMQIKAADMPGELKLQCAQSIGMYMKEASVADVEFIKGEALSFCKRQHTKRAVMRSAELLKGDDPKVFDKIQTMLSEALRAGEPPEEGHDLIIDFEERFVPDNRRVIPTPWARLNQHIKGGIGRGEIAVIMAPTGGGKSFWLVAIGGHAARLGYNVHHYTLELSKEVIGNRYDSFLTGTHLNELLENKELIREYYDSDEFKGNVKIKESYMRALSVAGIRTNLERAKQAGTPVDLLVVDYADIMKPSDTTMDSRIAAGVLFDELRALGQEYGCAVWTATQTNRSALEQPVVTLDMIGESYKKAHGSDLILAFGRTRDDKVKNVGRVFVAKNRNGADGMVMGVHVDLGHGKIVFMDEQDESILLSEGRDLEATFADHIRTKLNSQN